MSETINLLTGESPIKDAPVVHLSDSEQCIPQHYLRFEHSLESVEDIILNINFSEKYLIFVGEQDQQIYIQVGVIGPDNYQPSNEQSERKIVYGRKWRMEPQLPTSEIIQCAFLALQKAREHEIRELLKIRHGRWVSTPFNNHHDLPLMARSSDWLKNTKRCAGYITEADVKVWLANTRYDHATLELIGLEKTSFDTWLLAIDIIPDKHTQLPELQNLRIQILLQQLTVSEFYYVLMDKLLSLSNMLVEEHFKFKGFARFSRNIDIRDIGRLSVQTRIREACGVQDEFTDKYTATNYHVDQSRTPQLTDSPLGEKIRRQLVQQKVVDGCLPKWKDHQSI